MHLLIIEDSNTDLALILHSIRNAGLNWTFEAVTDGEDAMEYLMKRGKYARAPRPNLVRV